MSASREKQKRIDDRQNAVPEKNKGASDKSRKLVVGLVCGLLALGLLCLIVYGSGMLHTMVPVMTVNDQSTYAAEYNFYYVNQMSYYYQLSNSEYGAMFGMSPMRMDIPLSQQPMASGDTSGETYADYLDQLTRNDMETILLQYGAALKAGLTLTAEDTELMESSIKSTKDSATSQGMTLQQYLTQAYGMGLNEAKLRSIMERSLLAEAWSKKQAADAGITMEDITAQYNEDQTAYDLLTYHSYTLNGVLDSAEDSIYSDAQKDAFAASVKAMAQELEANAGLTTFSELAHQYAIEIATLRAEYEEEAVEDHEGHDHGDPADTAAPTTLVQNGTFSALTETAKTWATESGRSAGDKTLITNEDTQVHTVYLYVNRARDERPSTYSVRHILAKFDTEAEDKAADYDAQKARAEDILAQWQAGSATEESFAELAKENTDDGNGDVGGIYENVTPGNMVAPFENWMIGRSSGDTGIVETSFGFHVMYAVETAAPNWEATIRNGMETEVYNAAFALLKESMTVKQNGLGHYLVNRGK